MKREHKRRRIQMTDRVTNEVLVRGKNAGEIEDFIDSICGYSWDGKGYQSFTFNAIVPIPQGRARQEIWGTKSDAMFEDGSSGEYEMSEDAGSGECYYGVRYKFDTAYTAP